MVPVGFLYFSFFIYVFCSCDCYNNSLKAPRTSQEDVSRTKLQLLQQTTLTFHKEQQSFMIVNHKRMPKQTKELFIHIYSSPLCPWARHLTQVSKHSPRHEALTAYSMWHMMPLTHCWMDYYKTVIEEFYLLASKQSLRKQLLTH